MTTQAMEYHEVMAALPAYAAGILDGDMQAAVDSYLQRQITLFRRLDELEAAAGKSNDDRAAGAATAFSQVMEGQAPAQQIPGNPLLMRNAPQAYVDPKSGQRFVVPRRGTLQRSGPYGRSSASAQRPWVLRLLWTVIAITTLIAVAFIGLYQRNLQQQIENLQTTFADVETQMTLVSTANRTLSLRSANGKIQGTLLIRGQQAFFSIYGLTELPETENYQLWLRTADNSQQAVGLIPAQENRPVRWALVALPIEGTEIVAAGVSVEPMGGSPQPTTPMVVESIP
ncbi:MAG: anti-sigma factor [Caldilineaceae bacterium]